jgi:hypothetical protein
MTKIVDLDTGDGQSPHILLQQCRHLRRVLMAQVQESFARISSDVLPYFVDGERLLNRAAERRWDSDQLHDALLEVIHLESLCRRIDRLLRCYEKILTAPSPTNTTTSGTGNAGESGPSDHG